jgi:tRNA(Ile2) C34 agmatinyltransferase TiaS
MSNLELPINLPTSKESAAERLRQKYSYRKGKCPRCGGSMLGKGRHQRATRHTQAECDEQMVKVILTS